jgi:hypothetical protein
MGREHRLRCKGISGSELRGSGEERHGGRKPAGESDSDVGGEQAQRDRAADGSAADEWKRFRSGAAAERDRLRQAAARPSRAMQRSCSTNGSSRSTSSSVPSSANAPEISPRCTPHTTPG